MKCAASEELATSTAWMFEPYSWPMRWNTRSAPERSTRTATPGYLASNDLAIFSASGRSTEVYQTTLPSFFAASTSAGVTALAAGAADSTCVESAPPAASAPVPIIRSRREILNSFIAYPPGFLGWYFFVIGYRRRARQRSGGRLSQTSVPVGMLSDAPVSTRSWAPSL